MVSSRDPELSLQVVVVTGDLQRLGDQKGHFH